MIMLINNHFENGMTQFFMYITYYTKTKTSKLNLYSLFKSCSSYKRTKSYTSFLMWYVGLSSTLWTKMFDLHLKWFLKTYSVYVTIFYIKLSCTIEFFFFAYFHCSVRAGTYIYVSEYTIYGPCINYHLIWNTWSEMHDIVIFQSQYIFFILTLHSLSLSRV